jgi:hypothetical protein
MGSPSDEMQRHMREIHNLLDGHASHMSEPFGKPLESV